MTATAPAPQPTPEQLKAYAEQLPDVYKDILVAIQAAQPNRVIGEGVFASTVRNFLINLTDRKRTDAFDTIGMAMRAVASVFGPGSQFKFSNAVASMTDNEFSAAVERLADAGFFQPLDETRFGSLIPTPLGEGLITTITGRATPKRDLPELPKPTW